MDNLFNDNLPVYVTKVDKKEANALLVEWEHVLGPCNRPFGQEFWGLVVHNVVVSLAVSASTVSPSVVDEVGHRWERKQVVELARICTKPGEQWATRPMLRLWRSVLAPMWHYWPVQVAVSYATPGKKGDIYRFDGWTFVRKCPKSRPGKGSWSNKSQTDTIGDGIKSLWIYRY